MENSDLKNQPSVHLSVEPNFHPSPPYTYYLHTSTEFSSRSAFDLTPEVGM